MDISFSIFSGTCSAIQLAKRKERTTGIVRDTSTKHEEKEKDNVYHDQRINQGQKV